MSFRFDLSDLSPLFLVLCLFVVFFSSILFITNNIIHNIYICVFIHLRILFRLFFQYNNNNNTNINTNTIDHKRQELFLNLIYTQQSAFENFEQQKQQLINRQLNLQSTNVYNKQINSNSNKQAKTNIQTKDTRHKAALDSDSGGDLLFRLGTFHLYTFQSTTKKLDSVAHSLVHKLHAHKSNNNNKQNKPNYYNNNSNTYTHKHTQTLSNISTLTRHRHVWGRARCRRGSVPAGQAALVRPRDRSRVLHRSAQE